MTIPVKHDMSHVPAGSSIRPDGSIKALVPVSASRGGTGGLSTGVRLADAHRFDFPEPNPKENDPLH